MVEEFQPQAVLIVRPDRSPVRSSQAAVIGRSELPDERPNMSAIAPEAAVDLDRYPLFDPIQRATIIDTAKQSLADTGSAVFADFLRADAVETMADAAGALFEVAHRRDRMLGAYEAEPEAWMDDDHPVRRTSPYRMHVIATDQFDRSDPTLRLYEWDPFLELVREILDLPELHRLTDPLMRCNLTFLGDGDQHGWHFDGNDFVVSLLLQRGEEGGAFEFAPGIRTTDDENYDAVRSAMDEQPGTTRLLTMEPGTLVLFQGRYALHRVTEVRGPRPRIIALFSFDEEEETNHGPEVHRRIFGRAAGEAPVP